MGLICKRHIGLAARNKQQAPPRLTQLFKAGVGGMEGPQEIDFDHGPEPFRRNRLCRRDEIASCAAHRIADRSQRLAAGRNGILNRDFITNVRNSCEDSGTSRFE